MSHPFDEPESSLLRSSSMAVPVDVAKSAGKLRRLPLDLANALAELPVPVYVIDRRGIIRWLNRSAAAFFGDAEGEHYMRFVAPEARDFVGEQFAAKILGASRATAYETVLIDRAGRRLAVDIDSVAAGTAAEPMNAVAVFGIAEVEQELATEMRDVRLTPRQLQVLRMLAGGCSTASIATRLHLSPETVRNHVRHLLRALGAHSRLEAVARARDLRIL